MVFAILMIVSAFALPGYEKGPEKPPLLEKPLALPKAEMEGMAEPQAQPVSKYEWLDVEVRKGDNLALLMENQGVSYAEVMRLLAAGPDAQKLTRLKPGQIMQIARDNEGQLLAVKMELDLENTLLVSRSGETFSAEIEHQPLTITLREAHGIIDDSLFMAGKEAGLSDNLIMKLADIFAWDVDFVLDIRSGDRFALVYEEVFKDGVKIRDGNVLAASFSNRGNVLNAARHTLKDGRVSYYTPEGRNMRKAFIRTPLDFTRISSKFTYNRPHPVLKGVTRPHRGVDYAAPTGTPVKVTGDGKVIFVGRNRGYGKHIIVQHGERYRTLYAHLNAYRKGMRKGKRVSQGQTIGYVGMTGLASGPHLHYEFRVDGVHRNPLTIKFPESSPLPESEKLAFSIRSTPVLGRLSQMVERASLASATAAP